MSLTQFILPTESWLPYWVVVALYLAVAFDHWRFVWQGGTIPERNKRVHSGLIAIGLILHGFLVHGSIFSATQTGDSALNLGLGNALSAILWMTVMIYWVTDTRLQLYTLQAFVLPPAALAILLQFVLPAPRVLPYAHEPLFKVHLMIAFVAYSLFTFAAMHAMLMATAERRLHQKTSLIRLPDFPPILSMEILLFRVIAIGFGLLTLTLLSGMLFSEQIFHQALKFNHKNFFTIVSWLIFAALLIGRYQYGWRGRTAIRWTLTGFVVLLLAYVGSKFVLEVILHRV